ncbi:dTDP-4-dehydrorhamnose reductase [Bacillus sp. SLBN-3]
MKILVTGGSGQLGSEIIRQLKDAGRLFMAPERSELDVTDAEQTTEFIDRTAPDIIIHCAAFTDVDRAEEEQERAFLVNATGTMHIAEAASAVGAVLVYISTDYVFDGKKKDPYLEMDHPVPLNAYGKSKLAGEEAVRKTISRHYIVRTSWVFGGAGPNFIKKILTLSKTNNTLKVVDDAMGSPTYTVDLAGAILRLIQTDRFGTFHLANGGACSWYDLATEAIRLSGSPITILPCSSEEYPSKADRPRYSVLGNHKTQPLPQWQNAVKRYLASISV